MSIKSFFKISYLTLGIILSIIFTVFAFLLIEKYSDRIPDVKSLLLDNQKSFIYFIISCIGLATITFSLYFQSLGFVEEETHLTIKVSILCVILWNIFWILWSLFCAWLTTSYYIQSTQVRCTILLLVMIPGSTAFMISKSIRHQQIKQENEYKKVVGEDYEKLEPYTICIERKYYSGYYGLICLPVYLISLLIGQIFLN